MIKNEFIKLVTNKVFGIFLVLMLLGNAAYLYWSMVLHTNIQTAAPEEYNRLAEELSVLDDKEKQQLISQRLEHLTDRMEEEWTSIAFIAEINLYKELSEDLEEVISYQETTAAILSNADRQMERAQEDSYTYRLCRKTKQAYSKLLAVSPAFYPKRGLEYLLGNRVMDCCVLFFLLIAVCMITMAERQKQLSILARTTVYGQKRHNYVKAAVLGLVCVFAALLFSLESFFIIHWIYPFQSLSVPVQSVYAYCPLKVSIFTFLVICLLLKIMFYLSCVSIFSLIGYLCRRTVAAFMIILSLLGAFAVLYVSIPSTSYLAFINRLNPIRFSMVAELLSRYQCVNIFGYALNLTAFYVLLWIVLIILFTYFGAKVFHRQEEKETVSEINFHCRRSFPYHACSFLHECYKVFVAQKVLLLLGLAAVAAYFIYVPVNDQVASFVELMYNHYSEGIEGKYTDDIRSYISANIETLDQNAAESGAKEKDRYGTAKEALQEMDSYAQYLSGLENSYFINNKGFLILTGENYQANRRHIVSCMIMFAFAAVCFIQALSIDYQNGEIRIVQSTYGGRKRYRKEKLLTGCLVILALLLIFWLPELLNIVQAFGTEHIFAPAYSLQHLSGLWKGISVFHVICFSYIAILCMLAVIMVICYFVEKKIKNGMLSIIFMCAVIELPMIVLYISYG